MYTRRPQFRRASTQRSEYAIEQLKKLPGAVPFIDVRTSLRMVKFLSSEIQDMLGLQDALSDLEKALTILERLNIGYWDPSLTISDFERMGVSSGHARFVKSVIDEDSLRESVYPLITALEGHEESELPYSEVIEKIEDVKSTQKHGARFTYEETYQRLLALQTALRKHGLEPFSPEITRAFARLAEANPMSLDPMGLSRAGIRSDEGRELREAYMSLPSALTDYTLDNRLNSSKARSLSKSQPSFPYVKPAPRPEPAVEPEIIPEPPRKRRAPARRRAPEPVVEPEIISEPPRKRRAPARRRAPEPVVEPEIIPEPPRKKRSPARKKSPAGSKRAPAGMPKGLLELATYAKSRKITPSYTSDSVILSNGASITIGGGQFHITRPNGKTFSSWEVRDIMAVIRQDS